LGTSNVLFCGNSRNEVGLFLGGGLLFKGSEKIIISLGVELSGSLEEDEIVLVLVVRVVGVVVTLVDISLKEEVIDDDDDDDDDDDAIPGGLGSGFEYNTFRLGFEMGREGRGGGSLFCMESSLVILFIGFVRGLNGIKNEDEKEEDGFVTV